jgi:IS5 family transposase
MKQLSFSDAEYGDKRKRTRREVFLVAMHRPVPWAQLEAPIEPPYPKAGGGRRPYPLATTMRIHCLQQWYGLSDPAMEAELYESLKDEFTFESRGPIEVKGKGRVEAWLLKV